MCARFTLVAPRDPIIQMYDLDLLLDIGPRYNIAPTQEVLAVRIAPEGTKEFAKLRWGLVPSWASDLKIGQKLLNARSETVAEKPSFRSAFKKRRCLVTADGFFEWKTDNKKKFPFLIHRPGHEPFAFAGIWEKWHSPDGKIVESCSLLTTAANDFMQAIHDRMPVIIAKPNHERWLDPSLEKLDDLQNLLLSGTDTPLRMYPVTPLMNNPRFEDPSCIVELPATLAGASG